MKPSNGPLVKALSVVGYIGCVRRVVKPVRILSMRPGRPRFGAIFLLAIVMVAVAPCSSAQPQQRPKPGDSFSEEPKPGDSVSEERPVRFRVEIDAPRPYEARLRERLPLMRWQSSQDFDRAHDGGGDTLAPAASDSHHLWSYEVLESAGPHADQAQRG